MAYYVCPTLDRYDALFIAENDLLPDRRPPCHGKRDLFEVDLDLRTPYFASPFRSPISGGGVLFRKVKEQKNDVVALQN